MYYFFPSINSHSSVLQSLHLSCQDVLFYKEMLQEQASDPSQETFLLQTYL